MFGIKVVDRQTDRQTDTSMDNKGRLKLAAREPIDIRALQRCCGILL